MPKPTILPDLSQQDPVLTQFKTEYLAVCEQQRKRKEIYGEDLHFKHFEQRKRELEAAMRQRIADNNLFRREFFPEVDEKVVQDYLERRKQVFDNNKDLPVVFNPPPKVYKDRDRTDLHSPVNSRVTHKNKRKHPADDPPVMDNAIKYRGKRTQDPHWRNHRRKSEE